MPNEQNQMPTEALSPDNSVPRISLSEKGFNVLKTSNYQIIEEKNLAFRFPRFFQTIEEMSNNPTVGSALNVYNLTLNRSKWKVVAPVGASDITKQRAKFLNEVMHDMEHSWSAFISSIVPYLKYGYGISEIVLRRRLKSKGSKYNDGLVGLRKLAPRAQESIVEWNFTEDGREFLGVGQSLDNLEWGFNFQKDKNERGVVPLPIDRLLVFSADSHNGNPQGQSIFKNIYLAYKQLTLLQDQQLLGTTKDSQGLPLIELPPKYLDPNASDEDKAVYTACQKMLTDIADGKRKGIIFPKYIDPETKLDMFKVSILEAKGTSKYDTESIIRGLQNDILVALNVDVLKLGADGVGSFSLADAKTSMLSMAIERRLQEIADVLNTKLIPALFKANGWELTELPEFVFNDIDNVSLEEASKFVQRVFSVGAIEVDRGVMNKIREMGGFDTLPENEPVDIDNLSSNLTGKGTRAGDGMTSPTGNGTAKQVSGRDNSVANTENKA